MHQIRFLPSLRPNPAAGAHNALPESLVGWGEIFSPYSPPRQRLRRLTLSFGDCSKDLGV